MRRKQLGRADAPEGKISMIISAVKKDHTPAVIRISRDVIGNGRLIYELSKNDLKKRFADSYFGIFWAFVNPIVTICVYWFIFTVGLRGASNEVNGYPFVLWLIAGLLPWFLFSEIITSGTNVMLEYAYLVKKIVFNISVLPVIKIVTATVIHLILLLFTLLIFVCTGHLPDIYLIQIPYYMLSLWVFSLSVIFITSSVVLFFRDLGQLVNIFMQVFIWITPIMWQDALVVDRHPVLVRILRLNPMYYIVKGYRDAMIHHVWFWEDIGMTVYFWTVTILLFILGTSVFARLKPHFSDVI